jgi:hypothetical protein
VPFLLSQVKSVFSVAYQFLEVKEVGLAILSGIDYFVGPVDVFEAALEVVECVLRYVDFKRPGFHLYPLREE